MDDGFLDGLRREMGEDDARPPRNRRRGRPSASRSEPGGGRGRVGNSRNGVPQSSFPNSSGSSRTGSRSSGSRSRGHSDPEPDLSITLVGVWWVGWFLPASFVTQIWAGSSFSPGQGGGFRELIFWSLLFGFLLLVFVAFAKEIGYTRADTDEVRMAIVIGFFLGALYFVYRVSATGGMPSTGSWWPAPAGSALAGSLIVLIRFRGS